MSVRLPKTKKTRLIASTERSRLFGGIALAITCFGPMQSAHALALGELSVNSHIGEFLDAEVELLSVEVGHGDLLIARLADEGLHSQFKIPRTPSHSDLRFEIDSSDPNNAVVRIRSINPINEPFLNVLLAIEGPSGTIVREIAILLDPLIFPPRATASNSASIEELPTAQTFPLTDGNSARSDNQIAPSNVAVEVAEGKAELYVNRGDTLMQLAATVTPSGASVPQTTVALYQANPSAFSGSIHRMRHSVVLQVPSVQSILAIPRREALAAVRLPVRKAQVASSNTEQSGGVATGEKFNTPQPRPEYVADTAGANQSSIEELDEGLNGRSDVDIDLGDAAAPVVAAARPIDPSQIRTVMPVSDELLEMRGLISDIRSVLNGLDNSVSEKISELETIDLRVVELQASFVDIESRIQQNTSSGVVSSGPEVEIPADVLLASESDFEESEFNDEKLVDDTESSAEEIDALASVLLDPQAIDDARSNGTLNELVEEAKEQALNEAIDRGAVSQDTDDELVSTELLESIKQSSVTDAESVAATENLTSNVADNDASQIDTETAKLPVVAPSSPASPQTDYSKRPAKFPDSLIWDIELYLNDSMRLEQLRISLLNGGLILIAGPMFVFLYRRWTWRREVRRMEEELNRTVDTSNSMEYYKSTLDGEELLEEELKGELRKNRAAHDVRLELLKFYAAKHDVVKYSDCARDMYRLTRGRVHEWQQVIEMGLKLNPNMNFYDVDDDGVEPNLLHQKKEPVPNAQTSSSKPEFELVSETEEGDHASIEHSDWSSDAASDNTQSTETTPKESSNDAEHVSNDDLTSESSEGDGLDVEVHFNDDSVVDFSNSQISSDDSLGDGALGEEFEDFSAQGSTGTGETAPFSQDDSYVDVDLFDESTEINIRDQIFDLSGESANEIDISGKELHHEPSGSASVSSDGSPIDKESSKNQSHAEVDVETNENSVSKDTAENRVVDESTQRDLELKLVLARAYIDNRFLTEATDLLNEVVEKGTESQERQAKLMMRDIGGNFKKRA